MLKTLRRAAAAMAICLAACATPPAESGLVLPDIGAATPWTRADIDSAPGDFSFAVIGDRTGTNRPIDILEIAVDDLNLLRPDLVMGVGDSINGYTDDRAEIERQWDEFDAVVGGLEAPFFRTVGNHDMSNATMRAVWEERFGRRYYHFVYRNVLFLVMDSEEFSDEELAARQVGVLGVMARFRAYFDALDRAEAEGTPPPERPDIALSVSLDKTYSAAFSEEQIAYMENAIAENADVDWTFVFFHKPVWQGDVDSQFARIERALAGRDYTVIAGHVHNYAAIERLDRHYIRMGTTGGAWKDGVEGSYDHVMLVNMVDGEPRFLNLKLDGMLDVDGRIMREGRRFCLDKADIDGACIESER